MVPGLRMKFHSSQEGLSTFLQYGECLLLHKACSMHPRGLGGSPNSVTFHVQIVCDVYANHAPGTILICIHSPGCIHSAVFDKALDKILN